VRKLPAEGTVCFERQTESRADHRNGEAQTEPTIWSGSDIGKSFLESGAFETFWKAAVILGLGPYFGLGDCLEEAEESFTLAPMRVTVAVRSTTSGSI
jgi:hypothetical protein